MWVTKAAYAINEPMKGQRFFLYSYNAKTIFATSKVTAISGREQVPKPGKSINFKTEQSAYKFTREK